jgi:hypothetical protein
VRCRSSRETVRLDAANYDQPQTRLRVRRCISSPTSSVLLGAGRDAGKAPFCLQAPCKQTGRSRSARRTWDQIGTAGFHSIGITCNAASSTAGSSFRLSPAARTRAAHARTQRIVDGLWRSPERSRMLASGRHPATPRHTPAGSSVPCGDEHASAEVLSVLAKMQCAACLRLNTVDANGMKRILRRGWGVSNVELRFERLLARRD